MIYSPGLLDQLGFLGQTATSFENFSGGKSLLGFSTCKQKVKTPEGGALVYRPAAGLVNRPAPGQIGILEKLI